MVTSSPNLEVVAQEFWSGTRLESTFPRNLEHAVTLKLPLACVKLPVLTVQTVEQWLAGRQLVLPLPLHHYDLLGCLVVQRGHGFIFVCSADSADEQRFTLAHEVAHFLKDYLWPRQQVIAALGGHITDVLDGARMATPAERAAAILSRVRLGAHIHLLPRPGTDTDGVIAQTEARADQLALELIAPRERINSFLQNLPAREAMHPQAVCAALAAFFGLPAYAFDAIVRRRDERRPVSFLEDVRAALRRHQ
ncbi:MAG: ImmA/IrrE family metallo-endopeptidase [Deltaproteobacteria bacterium]|nr:ImmA/IrrE family metallo-endopeptidase [Deltaproteobacteria bacterium]